MKKIILILCAAGMILFSGSSFAAQTIVGKVERIFVSDTHINFWIEGDACKSRGETGVFSYWRVSSSNRSADAYLALLLDSARNGSILQVRVKTCNPEWSQNISYIVQDF